MIVRRQLLLGITMAAALAGAACGESSSTSSSASSSSGSSSSAASAGSAGANLGTAAVTINATDSLKFDPATVTAHTGDIVAWKNTGSVTHTVTFDSQPSLNDNALNAQGNWQVKFSTAGTYQFHCTIHPSMTGTVTVS